MSVVQPSREEDIMNFTEEKEKEIRLRQALAEADAKK
jgi:hypothetical protein